MSVAEESGPPLPDPIERDRVIPLIRGASADTTVAVADALVAIGFTCVEVTLDGPDGVDALAAVVDRCPDVGCVLAGTVLDRAQLDAAIDAGADALVSPHTDPDLVNAAARRGIASLPGAFTPTEVLAAWRAGAAAVKLFPAEPTGPSHLGALHGPLGDVPLIPTGGITADNAEAYLTAGAVAVGVGGWLTGGPDRPARVAERGLELLRRVRPQE